LTATVAVVAPAAIVAVGAPTVATLVLLELTLKVNPPAGAGLESVSVRFCVEVPLIVRLGGEKLTVVAVWTVTVPVPDVRPEDEAVIVADPTATPVACGCVAGWVCPAAMVTLGGTVTFEVSELTSDIVTPAWGAGNDIVTGNDTDWPGATVVFVGTLILPAFCTVIVAVAFTTNDDEVDVVIVAVPDETLVTGTGTLVAPAARDTVAGTVATPVALEVRFTVRPPAGAGDASVSVRFWVCTPVIVRVGGVKLSVVLPWTIWFVVP
jgi:hypothetical protein